MHRTKLNPIKIKEIKLSPNANESNRIESDSDSIELDLDTEMKP